MWGSPPLISRLSAARPKIANYPFTTLQPEPGVVELEDYRSFVVADIPGLIAGAHLGQGLGIQFLRHIERTKVLLHLVDLAGDHGRDPVVDYETVNRELAAFNPAMLQKPTLVVASKIDAIGTRPNWNTEQAGEEPRPGMSLHFRGYRSGPSGSQAQDLGYVGDPGWGKSHRRRRQWIP